MPDERVERIIDANINRLTEGLKVVEDVLRLGFEQRRLLVSVRSLRTRLSRDLAPLRSRVISSRDSGTDPGRGDRFDRTGRKDLAAVLGANLKRSQEAARVLEEVLKIDDPRLAGKLKQARFKLYDLEVRAAHSIGLTS